MGSAFLNKLTNDGCQAGTVRSYERTLTNFYYYLAKKGYLKYYSKEHFIKSDDLYRTRKEYVVSPFKGVIYPSTISNNVAHMIPEKYILPFLETVVRIANPIALGVYFQLFGGVRQGEVVNIQKQNLHLIGAFGEDGVIIELRNKDMRPDLKDSSGSSGVKKERNQLVYPVSNWLVTLFKRHLEIYISNDGSDAFFVNRDGKAMSGRSYRYYFNKAKAEFLKVLSSSNDPEDKVNALKLRHYKWSTHIGRGIFTNLLAEESKNPYDIALPRGDSDLATALIYQANTQRMKENLERRMNDLYKGYIPKLINK